MAAQTDGSRQSSAPAAGWRAGSGMLSIATGLSELDRQLIELLQENGRASYAFLASQVGTTEKIVRSRVLALLSSGIIDITTVTDPRALGYRYVAMIGVKTAGIAMSGVADQLEELEGVDYVVSTMGRYNILVEVFCRGLTDLQAVIEDGIQAIPGVVTVEAYLYLSLFYQESAFELARSKAERDGAAGGPSVDLDEVDVSVVNMLNANGRESFRTVASELSISETQVRRRVARMQEAGVLKIMAIINPMSLGFEAVALLGVAVSSPKSTQEVADELSKLTSVTYVAICAGRFDLWVELVCRSMEDFLQLMDLGIRAIPGVARVEPFVYLDLRYRPVPATITSAATAGNGS
jgi:Lrp/AsnC family transcriptional regulator for asnA, asnC and gidA